MKNEKLKQEAYSPHHYIDDGGDPDYEKIFSRAESPLKRHIDDWLLRHLDSQPEIVREFRRLKYHLKECEECRKKTEPEKIEISGNLPF